MKASFKVWLTVLALALATLAMITLATQPARAAGPWYAAPGGDDGNSCLSPGAACATINGAIAKASSGDTIYVATGTYTSTVGEVVLLDKNVTLSGGWDASFTTQSGTSTIDGEDARRGMAVGSGVTAIIERFTVQNGDTDGQGGGIVNWGGGTLTLNNSTVSGNMANENGGGILNYGTLTLNNGTVSGNMANEDGGGIGNWGIGTLTLNNSTVSDNTARQGGGISGDTVTLQNSILAGNTGGISPDCSGAISSSGYSLIGDTSGCTFTPGTGDLTNVSADLGPLVGSPGYHPLSSGSPAIDAVPLGQCTVATDQRGVARPQGPACDIGAYEYTTPGPAASILAIGGTPQTTPPSFAFWLPLQAAVLDSIGSPVNNVTVTFSTPAGGASGTFADSGTVTTTAVTAESGVATAATFTANGLEGSYTVTATVSGVVTPTKFLLSNLGWYVAQDGSDANDCQTPTTPCATINGPLGKAGFTAGDTVLVAAGTYTGTGDEVVLLDKSVRLLGGWDGTFTTQSGISTIDGEDARRGMTVNRTAIVERFAVQNGGATVGVGRGILNAGTLTLDKVHIRDNGLGILNTGILTLNNSAVTANGSIDTGGSGIYNSGGTLTLNNSTVSGNAASPYYSAPIGGIANHTGLLALNNTTVSNNAHGGIWSYPAGVATLQNTIVAGNKLVDGSPYDCDAGQTLNSLGYNLIGAAHCTINSTTGDQIGSPGSPIDPGLRPLTGLPAYHPLLLGSPAIDAGNPAGCTDNLGNPLPFDQRGAPRVGRCDIGAYEYTSPGPAASISAIGGTPQRTPPFSAFGTPFQALVLDHIGTPVDNATATFSAPASGASGTFADSGTFTTTAVTDENGVATAATFTANGLEGSYTVTATVSGVVIPTYFQLSHFGWYVALGGNDSSNDCLSPTTPCATINGVLAKAGFTAGDTVLVATGTYTGTDDQVVLLDKSVRLLGGWDGAFTTQGGTSTIDGGDSRKGIRVNSGVTAVVERFTVQNGSSLQGGGISLVGGGIYNGGTLTLNNSTVSGNTAMYGGGISNGGGISSEWGTLTLNNSTVSGNTAEDGGGIYNGGGGTLTLNNSTVNGNTAESGGGGIYNSGEGSSVTLILNNSTVSGNTANGDGGGILNGGTVTLNNSTISDNTAGSRGGVDNGYAGTATLQNTILAGNMVSGTSPDCYGVIDSSGYNLIGDTSGCTFSASTGDLLNVDARLFPLIDSPGYHPLLRGSPAIDAGNPAGCTDHLGNPLDTDQRGVPRVGRCDIGSYEFDPAINPLSDVFLPIILRNY